MMNDTMSKVREMIGANAIVGDPITTPDGVTIIPISKVSFGFAGGGSDFVPKTASPSGNPFGGGTGMGVHITPIAFLICKGENVRMTPIAVPADSSLDRIIEQVPDLIDKIAAMLEARKQKKAEPAE